MNMYNYIWYYMYMYRMWSSNPTKDMEKPLPNHPMALGGMATMEGWQPWQPGIASTVKLWKMVRLWMTNMVITLW